MKIIESIFVRSCHVALAAVALSTAPFNASATIIATWTFETSAPAASNTTTIGPISPEVGSGTATGVHASSLTDWSSPAGNGSAHSWNSTHWAIGDYYQFQVSTLGMQNIMLSWDQTSSSTGPADFTLEYGTGGPFTNFANYGVQINASPNNPWNMTTSSAIYSFSSDLSSIPGINNAAVVDFRLTMRDTTSEGEGTVGATGTDRVDNVVVTATPEPSTAVLFGLGAAALLGCVWCARKRRIAANSKAIEPISRLVSTKHLGWRTDCGGMTILDNSSRIWICLFGESLVNRKTFLLGAALMRNFIFVLAFFAGLMATRSAVAFVAASGNQSGPTTVTGYSGDINTGFTVAADVSYDPAAGPWDKQFQNTGNPIFSGQNVAINETLTNAGLQAWTDWHEQILSTTTGGGPDFLFTAGSLSVFRNGVPLTQGTDYTLVTDQVFNASATVADWSAISLFFNTASEIQVGDKLQITKQIYEVFGDGDVWDQGEIALVGQYPSVPEPGSFILAAMAFVGLGAWGWRRRKR